MKKLPHLPYNGVSHLTLLYLQMKRNPVLKNDIFKFYHHKFRDSHAITRVLDSLKTYNFVTETSKGYEITNWGQSYLNQVAKPYKGSDF